jgi:hypothetical protein
MQTMKLFLLPHGLLPTSYNRPRIPPAWACCPPEGPGLAPAPRSPFGAFNFAYILLVPRAMPCNTCQLEAHILLTFKENHCQPCQCSMGAANDCFDLCLLHFLLQFCLSALSRTCLYIYNAVVVTTIITP